MYQRNECHLATSHLTDTRNALLCETNYKYISVKNPLAHNLLLSDSIHRTSDDLQRDRQHILTSTVWKDSALLSKHLRRLDVRNKYLDLLKSHESKGDEESDKKRSADDDICIYKKKKKTRILKRRAKKKDTVCDSVLFGAPSYAPEHAQAQGLPLSVESFMLSAKSSAFCFGASNISHMDMFECRGFQMNQMPVYQFAPFVFQQDVPLEFSSVDDDAELLFQKKQRESMETKTFLLNTVSTSLMHSPNYEECNDPFRILLSKAADSVICIDPEFILKVALYARQELHIRSTSNFLLAYSAYKFPCRPFLKKYFSAAIRLPSDWLAVAEIYITFKNVQLKPGSLPAMLRKVMASSFAQFDEYQLAKYNKKKKNKHRSSLPTKKSFTLKQLIRILHITSPVEPVMCLLGKKYPCNPESFRNSGLPGNWSSEKAGKRMKLTVPDTWETKISSEGNKAHVWESLIESSKLPYMATLRNLKNLIMSGVSKQCHLNVLNNITNKNAVLKSRQFPLRFYTAYKTVEDIEKTLLEQRDFNGENSISLPAWKKKQKQLMLEKIRNVDLVVLNKYKSAISKALEISVLSNVDPIGGKTLVICDLVEPFKPGSLDINEKAYQNCILFGLLCLKACEDCEMMALCSSTGIKAVELENQPLLENLTRISSLCKPPGDVINYSKDLITALNSLFERYLYPNVILTKKLNNIVFLLSSCGADDGSVKETVNNFLYKYRQLVNPDLFYVQINITSSDERSHNFEDTVHLNNVYLSGFSDQVLKFLAEKGSGRQLTYVETIDQKYELNKVNEVCVKIAPSLGCNGTKVVTPYDIALKWKTIRVFISSTFKDMHGERDLLIRYVIPELKARAAKIYVKIIEVDLRWGINEEYSASKKCAEFCLREAQRCDIFIGILGERYGTVYKFDPPDDPELDWIKNYPTGSSITELEIEAGALRRTSFTKQPPFFYIRSNNFLSNVPKDWISSFVSEDENARNKLSSLKDRIRNSGVHLYDGYTCSWGGVVNEKPFVSGLELFGNTVLEDLWYAVQESHHLDKYPDEISAEHQCQQSQIELYNYFIGEQNTPLNWMVKEIKGKDGVFVVTGSPGCGKSAFIVKLIKEIGADRVIPFFIGATSRSTELLFMLSCITHFLSKAYPSSTLFIRTKQDIINQFHDILAESAKVAGGNLVLIMDGLDQLDSNAQTLDWFPCIIPQGTKIICSASDSSVACKVLYKRAQSGLSVQFAPLSHLNVQDRKTLVKDYLAEHGKSLDENPFNNQMIQFITKVDCGIPLYICLACDYLRLFATFENLMSTIQNLPSTLMQLMEHIIMQMEKQHGANTVQKALTLLCTVKEGLEESELHLLLSIAISNEFKEKEIPFEDVLLLVSQFRLDDQLPPIDYRSLLHMIYIFMLRQKRDSFMRLSSMSFIHVLEKSYANKGYMDQVKYFHSLLAAYYMVLCDPKLDGSWTRCSSLALRSLPFHLYNGQCYKELAEILCSLKFIQAVFQMHADEDLLTYYMLLFDLEVGKAVISSPKKEILDTSKLKDYCEFVSRNSHVLLRYPQTTQQQALNEPTESWVYKSVLSKRLAVECLTKSALIDYRWLTVNVLKTVTCVALHSTKSIAAMGNEDGYLKAFDFQTGKALCSLKGHTSLVTSVCFVGSDRVCTSSSDNTICIWSIIDYFLVGVLRGHTRYISNCISDPTGKFILSSSWDCSVRFWNAENGSEISTLSEFGCPVNCLSHHPDLQLFACGLWDGNIEIWNSLSLKKKSVLQGHTGSVKFLAYSSDGFNIISSSSAAEVFIWSSLQEVKIGKLKGHVLPVNSIQCSFKNYYFVSASDDCTLKVWSNQQMTPVHTITESKFCPIHFMEIVQTNLLTVAFQNGTVWLVDLIDGHVIKMFENLSENISCFSTYCGMPHEVFSREDEDIAILIKCGTVSGKVMALSCGDTANLCYGNLHSTITFLTHTRYVIFSGTSNGDVGLLSTSDLDREASIVYGAHDGSVTALSVSLLEGSGLGLSASTDMTLKLWKITYVEEMTISLLKSFGVGHRDFVTSCFLLPVADAEFDKVRFISGSADNTVAFWHNNEPTVLEGLQASIVKVYSIENYVFGCSRDGGIAVWNKNGSLITRVMSIQERTTAVAYDLHHDMLDEHDISIVSASVNSDGSIAVKKPFQRSQLCTLEGHSKAVTACCANETGNIISCSPDKTLNVWKIPATLPERTSYHEGSITGVLILASGSLGVTADISGNLILWTIEDFGDVPMHYCSHKKYVGGYINLVAAFKENSCLCAVTFPFDDGPKYVVAALSINRMSSDSSTSYVINEDRSEFVDDEVKCIDFFETLDAVVIGLKSGCILIVTPDLQKSIQLTNDWILKVKITDKGPNLCTVEPSGAVKQYPLMELLNTEESLCSPKLSFTLAEHEAETSVWATAMCVDKQGRFFIGDSKGWLRIVSHKVLQCKQIHTDSLTDICFSGSYLITCSLDRTVKIWDIFNLRQVAQFHSSAPISCLAMHNRSNTSENTGIILIGSTVGSVQLLKWWPE